MLEFREKMQSKSTGVYIRWSMSFKGDGEAKL